MKTEDALLLTRIKKHAVILMDKKKKTTDKSGKSYSHYEISCFHLSRDFNSDFVKNLIHNVLAFFFIIRAIKDVIKGVIDLEGKERGTKQLFSNVLQVKFIFLTYNQTIHTYFND